MTYLKCEGSYLVRKISFKQSGWRCYKWQQIQRGNYGLREKYVYVNSFLLKVIYPHKILRKIIIFSPESEAVYAVGT